MNVSDFYKTLFSEKVYKISLDAGCTCPTRDGTKGFGGCIFCSANGSGDFVPSKLFTISQQIEQAKQLLADKLKNKTVKYIAYFQNFTNTYGNIEELQQKWRQALECPGICGLAIATRPDCLGTDVLQALQELSQKTFLQVELGFQTSSENSAEYIRRGFSNAEYFEAVKNLHKINPKIHVVTHAIFGIPGEPQPQMMETVKTIINAGSDGIKITSLYVLKGTDLEKDFLAGKFTALEEEEYFGLVKNALALIPQNIVIHRLTGDPPKSLLTAPQWTMNKKRTMNIVKELLNGR